VVPARPEGDDPGPTVGELILAYWRHAEAYHVKDGRPTSEVDTVHQALRQVNKLCGMTPARGFGPLALRACQDAMIAQGWARSYINRQIDRVKRMFAWAVANGHIPVAVHQALATVSGLRKGRTAAKEKPPIASVPDAVVAKTLEHFGPTMAAMVSLQRLSGMRHQEVVGIRAADLDTSDPTCWPDRHKTEHLERERTVFIGPRVQEVIRPFLDAAGPGYLFSPHRAVAEHSAGLRAEPATRLWPSHVAHRARKKEGRRRRADGARYNVASHRQAIGRACDRAFPHPTLSAIASKDLDEEQRAELESWRKAHRWHPHQLRHMATTSIRRQFGLEKAQAVLGHSEVGTTQIHAEKDLAAARDVMRQIG
jgi:integrase